MRADFEFDKDSYPYAAAPIGAGTAKVWHVPTLKYVMAEPVPTAVAEAHARILNAKLRSNAKQDIKFTADDAAAQAWTILHEAVNACAPLKGTQAMAAVQALEHLKPANG